MSAHLTPEQIAALLAGRLDPEQEAALAAHLAEGDCPACEQVLAELDPGVEQRLLAVLARIEGAQPLSPTEAEAVLTAAAPRAWFARPWAWGPALAAAAAVVLVLIFSPPGPQGTDPAGQRVKGDQPRPGAIELMVGAVSAQPKVEARVRPINPDEVLTPGQTLVFRVRTEADGCHLYLLQRAGGNTSVLWPDSLAEQRPLSAGNHDLQRDGKPLGLSLDDSRGPQVFWSLCSLRPIGEPDSLRRLLPAPSADLPVSPPEGVSWDHVRVTVAAPGEGS